MLKPSVLILFLTFSLFLPKGQSKGLKNFLVKENLLKNDKIALVAADENDKPQEVEGVYQFSINGFKQELRFTNGVAVYPQAIEKSTFVYLKHINDSTTVCKLYFLLKKTDEINPIKINWKVLIFLPLTLIALAGMFRKFIVYAIIIAFGMFLFGSNKGLGLPTLFETIIDGIKSLF